MTTLGEFLRLQPDGQQELLAAEQKLLDVCQVGGVAKIADAVPKAPTPDNTVRAAFIRWLALGGDEQHRPHAQSVSLQGAWIEGRLDLTNANSSELFLVSCHFSEALVLFDAQIAGCLSLQGSCLAKGLTAERATIKGSVFLRKGFTSTGTILLSGAQIGGELDCSGATLQDRQKGVALSAERAVIQGGVFLCNDFKSTGTVNFAGANITGGLLLTKNSQPLAEFDLRQCQAGFLHSEWSCWGKNLHLDGLVYDNLSEYNWKAEEALQWLNKQSDEDLGVKGESTAFKPQPWQQLIKTLRAMGHDDDAKHIAIALQNHLRTIGKISGRWRCLLHKLFGGLAGYGYQPLKLLGISAGVWLFFGLFFGYAATQGVMAPSNPIVFQHEAYKDCVPADGKPTSEQNWYTCKELRGEYSAFSPLMYSLDVLLPVVDLGQENDWGTWLATPEHSDFLALKELLTHWSLNHCVRLFIWFEILYGWVASFILLAILTGITQRQEK